jgi:hypothetical protein
MRTWIVGMAAVGAVLAATEARADQCAWLDDPAVAERAARQLIQRPELVAFCEPCGDVVPAAPAAVTAVAVRPVGDGFVEVVVDGRAIDLAYAYVPTADGQYRNLALLAGCTANGVSPGLRVEHASTGVLIQAGAAPPPSPATIAAASAGTSISPPTVIHVVSHAPVGWMFLGLGWITALGMLGMWRLTRSNRRVTTSLPRAVELIDRHAPPPSGRPT